MLADGEESVHDKVAVAYMRIYSYIVVPGSTTAEYLPDTMEPLPLAPWRIWRIVLNYV
jgi:hypothetical protein